MSASNEWTEWHLTPRGWERGTEKLDFGGTTDRKIPKDRVLTKKYREKSSSIYSPQEKELNTIWSSNDNIRIQNLTKKFGECPKSL